MASARLDTRTIGLDTALALSRWLTGKEHLHYGLWTGIEVAAGNVGRAQDAYSARLSQLFPAKAPMRILDIGGGAGETAKKLSALGHKVEIVIPSAYLAARCRANAPDAVVHECRFEDLQSAGGFDLCLFSESFQYIPLEVSLPKAHDLLVPGGEIVIGDCFRREGFRPDPTFRAAGGGHPIEDFRAAIADGPLRQITEEDITEAVAPSIDLEQQLFNVLGTCIAGFNRELAGKRPAQHWLVTRFSRLILSARRRARLSQRLSEQARTSGAFIENNRYLLVRLARTS
jgi:MPBQ/MSBQ methyltransferase